MAIVAKKLKFVKDSFLIVIFRSWRALFNDILLSKIGLVAEKLY